LGLVARAGAAAASRRGGAAARAAAHAPRAAPRAGSRSSSNRYGPPKEDVMFGKSGGEPEGWEFIYYTGMGGSFLFIATGLYFRPDTTITRWARDEALAREQIVAEGGELEVGRNYSQERYGIAWEPKVAGERPKLVGA
jgi:hypothetical protein